MSFESDSEKNTPMKTTQIHRNRAGSKAAGDARRRQPPQSTRSADRVHGILPAKNTPPKNHHRSPRSAMGAQHPPPTPRTHNNTPHTPTPPPPPPPRPPP